MATGGYRISQEVSRPVGPSGGGDAFAHVAHVGAAGGPRAVGSFRAPTGQESVYRQMGDEVARSLKERDERRAADAALQLQTELAEAELPLYERRGLNAGEYAAPDEETKYGVGIGAGVASEWGEVAEKRLREVSDGLNAESRRRLRERMSPWIAAHKIGLSRHQMREARAGERAKIEANVGLRAQIESGTVAARMKAEEADGGADLAGAADLALMQVGIISQTGAADDYARAVQRGLYTQEEADALRQKNAGDTLRSLMGALIADGCDKAAEAVLGRVEGEGVGSGGVGSGGVGSGKGQGIAAACGVEAHELARWRSGIDGVRKRREAEAEAQERKAESERLERITLDSRDALADVTPGRLGRLENTAKRLAGDAGSYAEGSKERVVAKEEAKRLEAAAEKEAVRITWDEILKAAETKTVYTPPQGSRMERLYKSLKASFDRQAEAYAAESMLAVDAAKAEERRGNEAAIRTRMIADAAVFPGKAAADLAEDAANGRINLQQYHKLRDELQKMWTKEGMSKKAGVLVQILKREFYGGKDYDLNDRLGLNAKTGKFEYENNPDTKKPFEGEDVEFDAQVLVPYSPNDWFGLRDFISPGARAAHYETAKRTLTSADQLQLLDWAMDLAKHDGDETEVDPLTGERLTSRRKIDAAEEFQRLCSMLKASKRVEAAQDVVARVVKAHGDVESGFARFERGAIDKAERRERQEGAARATATAAKSWAFVPKRPSFAPSGTTEGGPANHDEEE